jgi:two-component system, NarL family, nitrate/nitrite response regulator NarL
MAALDSVVARMFKLGITREVITSSDMSVSRAMHCWRPMSLRVVIVDDSVEFLRIARSMLEREGITVVDSAQTGAEAIRSAQEHQPDVVLLDVGLGEESGFDVAERLSQASDARIRVILISARSEQDLKEFIDASPAIGFVPKAELSADAINHLLDGSPSS